MVGCMPSVLPGPAKSEGLFIASYPILRRDRTGEQPKLQIQVTRNLDSKFRGYSSRILHRLTGSSVNVSVVVISIGRDH